MWLQILSLGGIGTPNWQKHLTRKYQNIWLFSNSAYLFSGVLIIKNEKSRCKYNRLATMWLRILSLPPNVKTRNHLVAKPI